MPCWAAFLGLLLVFGGVWGVAGCQQGPKGETDEPLPLFDASAYGHLDRDLGEPIPTPVYKAPISVAVSGPIGTGDEGVVEPVAASPTGPAVAVTRTHTVRRGETLWKIAERYYGDGKRWIEIARANNIRNPHRVSIGTRIVLP